MIDIVRKIFKTAGDLSSNMASSINSPHNMFYDNNGDKKEEESPEGQLKDLNITDIGKAIKAGDKTAIEAADKAAIDAAAIEAAAVSDERLKNIFGDNEDAIKCFAAINAIEFTYNDKAKEIGGSEEKGVDDDPHYGVKAQELAENPLTESAVKRDPISDYLQVDTKELTMANTAIISEICKRILIIEKVLGIKVV